MGHPTPCQQSVFSWLVPKEGILDMIMKEYLGSTMTMLRTIWELSD